MSFDGTAMKQDFSVTLVQCPMWGRETPSFASTLLASNLRSKGFRVHLIDLNNVFFHLVSKEHKNLWSEEEFTFWTSEELVKQLIEQYSDEFDYNVRQIAATGSQLVGFTIYCTTEYFTLETIRLLKKYSMNVSVVVGGPGAIDSLDGRDLLKDPNVDAVVLNEGDVTLPEMCKAFEKTGKFEKVPGLVFKVGDQITNGGIRKPISSLDEVPYPDLSGFDFNRYAAPQRINIVASRSCINRCNHCYESKYFGRFRFRNGNSIFKEVQHQLSLYPEVNFVCFNDSVFNGSLKTLKEFSELLLENEISVYWGGQGIIREGMTPDLLRLMARAGCCLIQYGVESGSIAVRKSMNKNLYSNKLASRVIKETHEAGILVNINFMFGYPSETEEDYQMTLEFVEQNHQLANDICPAHVFTAVLPGTYLHQNPEEFNIEPNPHYIFWETRDGKNTYPIRLDRYERFCKQCHDLGSGGRTVPKEKSYKWRLLGDYYRHKKDYINAIRCYKKDTPKHGFFPESVKYFIEKSERT